MPPVLTPGRIRAARIIAVVADAAQLGLFPLFIEGAPGVFDAVLDVLVGIVLTVMLGWHLAFLPGFVSELLPIVDLFPSWTLAVLFVTRGGAPPVIPAAAAQPAAEKITDVETK